MVTEDRKALGLFDRMTVAENITIRRLPELTIGPSSTPVPSETPSNGRSRSSPSRRPAATPRSPAFGRKPAEMHPRPLAVDRAESLLLDEPTRGIDVGAKAEIYALIRKLASQGRAIIMTSSELPELLAVCDRIIVLCEGRLTAEMPRARPPRKHHARGDRVSRSEQGGSDHGIVRTLRAASCALRHSLITVATSVLSSESCC